MPRKKIVRKKVPKGQKKVKRKVHPLVKKANAPFEKFGSRISNRLKKAAEESAKKSIKRRRAKRK